MLTFDTLSESQKKPDRNIRKIYFFREGKHEVYDEIGIHSFIQGLPQSERDFLSLGGTFRIECADGICLCSWNTENGDIRISSVLLKPQDVTIDYSDTPFPGKEKLSLLLQKTCTDSFRIGTNVTIRFSDKTITFFIGVQNVSGVDTTTQKFGEEVNTLVS